MRSLVGLCLVALGIGCGGGSASGGGAASSAAQSAACLPVVPLQLLALEHGSEWEPVAWIDAGGYVFHGKRAQPFARINGDSVWAPDGRATMTCAGRNLSAGTVGGTWFDANDDLRSKDGMSVHVSDTGDVTLSFGGQADPRMHTRVAGDVRTARRTASLLVLLAMAGGKASYR